MCITFRNITLEGRDCFEDKDKRGHVILPNSFQSNTTNPFINAFYIAVSIVFMNEIVDVVISAVCINEIVVLDCEQISYIKTQR
jgi:hypothetical protein